MHDDINHNTPRTYMDDQNLIIGAFEELSPRPSRGAGPQRPRKTCPGRVPVCRPSSNSTWPFASLIVDSAYRLPQLNSVSIPDGVNDAAVRKTLLQDYNLEIGAGLGALAGKVWRIGLMGYASNRKNVLFCLSALENTLASMSAPIEKGLAVAAANQIYAA